MESDLFARSLGTPQILGRCILNVAFPFSAVHHNANGDAEQLVAKLDEAISESGGKSLVIAREDSCVTGELIPIPSTHGRVSAQHEADIWTEVRDAIERTSYEESVDLIHFHGIDFHRYMSESAIPKLVTLHQRAGLYPKEVFRHARAQNAFLHCVCQSDHCQCPNSDVLLSPITNNASTKSEYLRRYEIIIRGCNHYAAMPAYG
jgi:hypothetical protein